MEPAARKARAGRPLIVSGAPRLLSGTRSQPGALWATLRAVCEPSANLSSIMSNAAVSRSAKPVRLRITTCNICRVADSQDLVDDENVRCQHDSRCEHQP